MNEHRQADWRSRPEPAIHHFFLLVLPLGPRHGTSGIKCAAEQEHWSLRFLARRAKKGRKKRVPKNQKLPRETTERAGLGQTASKGCLWTTGLGLERHVWRYHPQWHKEGLRMEPTDHSSVPRLTPGWPPLGNIWTGHEAFENWTYVGTTARGRQVTTCSLNLTRLMAY